MIIKNKLITLILMIFYSLTSMAQVGIGTNTPNANSALELSSSSQGIFFPRMTSTQRDAIASPAKGLTIFNTDLNCIQTNTGTSSAANWKCLASISASTNGTAVVSAYSCSTASAGTMTTGIAVSGVTQTITATVTTVGTYSISTTANGVTFAATGTFTGTGAQTIVLTATGTPTAAGTHAFTLNTTPNCNFSRTTLAPLPANITLSAIGPYFVASVYDQDYLPYTAPTAAATLATAQAANSVNETFTLNVQGSLSTTGITYKIIFTVVNAIVSLPAFSQTINVPASYTEDGISRDVTFSYNAATLGVGSSYINATLKAIGGTLNAKKLDIQTGIGNDNLGWLLAQFTYATNNSGGTAKLDFRNIAAIPDRNITDANHVMFYMPVLGADGKIWLNNNLGADYANTNKASFNPAAQASSTTDWKAYGSFFQWGRYSDGHELITWSNGTTGTAVNSTTSTLSTTNTPTSSLFILNGTTPYDWRNPQNDNLWQGESGTNNPCPIGFRLPTHWDFTGWGGAGGINNNFDAAYSTLKIPSSGYRDLNNGLIYIGNNSLFLWSSTSLDTGTNRALFYVGTTGGSINRPRACGLTVRCIKN